MNKEISEDKYYHMLGNANPIRITTLDGAELTEAFAISEPASRVQTPEGPRDTHSAFYQVDDKYFEIDGSVYFTAPGIAIRVSSEPLELQLFPGEEWWMKDALGKKEMKLKKQFGVTQGAVDFYEGRLYKKQVEFPTTHNDWIAIEEKVKTNSVVVPLETSKSTGIVGYSIRKTNKRIVLIYNNGSKHPYVVVVQNGLTDQILVEYPATANPHEAAKNYIEAIGEYSESKIISEGYFTNWIGLLGLDTALLMGYAQAHGVTMHYEQYAKGGKIKKTSSYPKKGHILVREETPDRETEVFINVDIFENDGDYILGGFDKKDLDNIGVEGDSTILNPLKVKMLFRGRIIKAIEKFREELETNLINRVGADKAGETIEQEFDSEISNLMETYLYIKTNPENTTEEIADLIVDSESAVSWMNTIIDRITKFSSGVMFDGVSINKIDQSKVTIDDAEENTHNATLEQILEQLHSITEKVI